MANPDRAFGFIESSDGRMAGYVDRNGIERDMAGNPLQPGTRPTTAGLARTIAQSGVAASVTGTTNETTLATVVIPAGVMGINGGVRVSGLFSYTNSANNKTPRVKFGGTTYYGPTLTTTASAAFSFEIWNRGAANSQVGPAVGNSSPLGAIAVAPVTSSVDTGAAVSLTLTGQLANTGETITLEAYTVEILNP